MKTNLTKLTKAVLFVLASAALFWGIFAFLDGALHYKVGNWFERTFFIDQGYANWSNGGYAQVMDFLWPKFKAYLLAFGMAAAALWAASLALAVHLSVSREEQRLSRKLGKLLRKYFEENGKPTDISAWPEVGDFAADLKEKIDRTEERLRAESQRKNDLIAYLAHDLKTPLTSVIGYVSLLEEAPDMPLEQRAKFTGIALKKALRLEQLINEFFDITRYNTNQMVLEEDTFDLRYLLEQLADEFYPLLQQEDKSVHIDAADDLTITADPAKLARVCNNILKNAIAYSSRGTAIGITAEKKENAVRIAVSNRGKTIPKQQLDRIFEKFYRLDDARSTNTGGAGLGLAIAKEIVTAHGGTIRAESDQGVTTFTVELPV